jgi:DNA-binding CsgD family transcriptional regulator
MGHTILQEVPVWFRRWLGRRHHGSQSIERIGQAAQPENLRPDGRLVFELDAELSAQLRCTARARAKTPHALAADLLVRGLQDETLRAQAEAALVALTPREQQVAWLTARGRTNRQIAETLVISLETVKTHVRHVLDKFGVRSKTDLRLLLLDLGIRWRENVAVRANIPPGAPPRRDPYNPYLDR